MGIIMALAPMLSPIFGSLIMKWFSWHWVFFAQAALGVIAFSGVVRLEEPLKKTAEGSVLAAMGMYLTLLRNRRYMAFVLLFSIIVLPHFSFIGSAANLYINDFPLFHDGSLCHVVYLAGLGQHRSHPCAAGYTERRRCACHLDDG
jgi:MFS transporter, DHA1 family, multidrug resistance protein